VGCATPNGIEIATDANALIYIKGEVFNPGVQPYTASLRLLDAIQSAGGATAYASRFVVLMREQEVIFKQKLQDIESGEVENPLLRPDDIVVVPFD
jgi:protein involved in polysaccharide export with SLBB domain